MKASSPPRAGTLLITLVLVLGACGASRKGPSSPSSGTVEPTASPTVSPHQIEIDVADGRVTGPGRLTVLVGAPIALIVASDLPDEVHVHGYDLFQDVGPDSPAVIEFTANVAGIFEVELEHAGLLLLRLEVTP